MKSDKPLGFFKPEDFEHRSDSVFNLNCRQLADIANAKLERDAKVVYLKHYVDDCYDNAVSFKKGDVIRNPNRTALLICIEPVEICTHPRKKVKRKPYEPDYLGLFDFQCECGVVVQPKEFEEKK